MRHLPSLLPCWNPSPSAAATNKQLVKKIEEFRPGYPQFTALLSAYEPYLLCRRFDRLRARLLLLKQDRLALLEGRLDELDCAEHRPLFLGASRVDGNPERLAVLSEIDSCLAEYDDFVERTHRMLSLELAQKRDIRSLQNWLDGNGCLDKDEAAYLKHHRELITLATMRDGATLRIETWVEDMLIRFFGRFRKSRLHDVSNDPNVYIYSGPWIKRAAKALLLGIITLLLLMPVVICNIASTMLSRVIVVMVSTVCYLVILSWLTRSKTIELVLAGATYGTILIVFVSGSSVQY